jgi:hypothetical protein
MGLDMYLTADIYVSENTFSNGGFVQNPNYFKLVEALGLNSSVIDGYGFTVSVPVGYWRKANAIHNWFVKELANGVDECQRIVVSKEDLLQLKDLCEKIISSKDDWMALALLPPKEGFFFGSTDVDEYYYADLEHTVEVINNAISIEDTEGFVYRASW